MIEQQEQQKDRRRPRQRVFTDDVMRMIPEWVRTGADKNVIAAALGTTPGSLAVICSRHGISLNPLAYAVGGRAGDLAECMRCGLDVDTWGRLCRESLARKVPVATLIINIITILARDDLFTAVIDAEVPK